ncbi:sugar O-acetyltransferase [Pseudomonas profundi]|uniref:sugar O-acetyltransferase n=1 Tax=Pseudomonas profundi TaxID=1981513 RepID=UPI001CC24063|nr:sugar O-acetyltransferase [Pseudomonas profundi]
MSNSTVPERDKMLRGELYDPLSPELVAARNRARLLTRAFNHTSDSEQAERDRLLRELVPDCGSDVTIEPPFLCDYGDNITLGDRVFFNFNCVILDVARVVIGSNVLFGPGVQVYAATHPMSAAQRRTGLESGKPVTIGDDVWVGGGAVVCPGVTVGAGTVIGAGSVVTRDIPAEVFAAGNPCRVIKAIAD